MLFISDEAEPSWLEMKNFGLARLVTFFIQLRNFPIKAQKLAQYTSFYFD